MKDSVKGSEERLWALVRDRIAASGDQRAQADIDRRIWDLFGEEWSVMFTDLSGFSRNVAEFGITHFLQVIWEHKRLFLPLVAEHDGILIKQEADSLLVIFRRPESALACALAMQRATVPYNRDKAPEERVLLCVGIGHGRILRIGDADVYGQEVNAASRLGEDTARSGEVLLTGACAERLPSFSGVTFEDLGLAVPGSARNVRVHYEIGS